MSINTLMTKFRRNFLKLSMLPLDFFGGYIAGKLHVAGDADEFWSVVRKLRGFIYHGLSFIGCDVQNP